MGNLAPFLRLHTVFIKVLNNIGTQGVDLLSKGYLWPNLAAKVDKFGALQVGCQVERLEAF